MLARHTGVGVWCDFETLVNAVNTPGFQTENENRIRSCALHFALRISPPCRQSTQVTGLLRFTLLKTFAIHICISNVSLSLNKKLFGRLAALRWP
jgi:hypothetical protein